MNIYSCIHQIGWIANGYSLTDKLVRAYNIKIIQESRFYHTSIEYSRQALNISLEVIWLELA